MEEEGNFLQEFLDTGGDENVYNEIGANLRRIKRAMANERFAPGILPFEAEALKSMREVIDVQEELIDSQESSSTSSRGALATHLKKIEYSRLNYVIRCYLRSRLLKIERCCRWILNDEGRRARLSADELRYAEKYQELLDSHFRKSFLNLLPERVQSLDYKDGDKLMIPEPEFDKYIFCRVIKDVGTAMLSDSVKEEPMSFDLGEIYFIRYRAVRDMLETEKLELI